MKFSTTEVTATKEILANDHYVAIPHDLTDVDGEENGIIKAGTIVPSNGSQAIGVLLYDVDKNENPNGAVVTHGTINKEKLPEEPTDAAIAALKDITFLPITTGQWLSSEAGVPSQEKTFFGGDSGDKKVSDMITPDTKLMDDGSVIGTLKNVTGFTKFSSATDEQSGHYFPLTLKTTGTKVKVKKNGGSTGKEIDFDPDWILRVESNDTTFAFEVDSKPFLTVNFKKATLQNGSN